MVVFVVRSPGGSAVILLHVAIGEAQSELFKRRTRKIDVMTAVLLDAGDHGAIGALA